MSLPKRRRRGRQEAVDAPMHMAVAAHHEDGCRGGGGGKADGSDQQQTKKAPSHLPDATFGPRLGLVPSAG